MTPELQAKLLASIEADRLVIICGAGLSIAAPSSLPFARDIANAVYDKYTIECGTLPATVNRDDLESVAEFFATQGALETIFIKTYVPWALFIKPPNQGHATLADFLLCRVAFASLSANYDFLIEEVARTYGADFQASLDGDEANTHASAHSPLLKFHGCATRERPKTIWTKSQLSDSIIKKRIEKSKTWMAANLREKDLLVIGFWSDWDYLNEILGNVLQDVSPTSVIVVDPSNATDLERKAPGLWQLAHKSGVQFEHAQESSSEFLDQLRKAFSSAYIRKVLSSGIASFRDKTGEAFNNSWLELPPDLTSEDLYHLRRDLEGVPPSRAAKNKRPSNTELLGLFHILMRRAGAVQNALGYRLNDKNIRIVNGAGSVLNAKKKEFQSPPTLNPNEQIDLTVCVGATDVATPADIMDKGRTNDFMRPKSEIAWVDYETACEMLSI